jgi:hypothetical protein
VKCIVIGVFWSDKDATPYDLGGFERVAYPMLLRMDRYFRKQESVLPAAASSGGSDKTIL